MNINIPNINDRRMAEISSHLNSSHIDAQIEGAINLIFSVIQYNQPISDWDTIEMEYVIEKLTDGISILGDVLDDVKHHYFDREDD